MGLGKNMKNRQIDIKTTKQVRIDTGYHTLLKIKAATDRKTIKQLLEEVITEILGVPNDNN